MKNKLKIVLFLITISTYSFAQKSKEVIFTKKSIKVPCAFIHDAFSINSSEFIMVSYHTKNIFLRKLSMISNPSITLKNNSRLEVYKIDENLNLVMKKTINREIAGKRVWIEKLIKIGDNVWMFYSYSNVETKTNYLFAQKFDHINLELVDEPIKVAELPYFKKRFRYGFYNFNLSENGNYLMISGIPYNTSGSLFKPQNSDYSSSFTVWVLNQNMEIVNYAKKIKFEGGSKEVYLNSSIMSNDGSFLFVWSKESIKESKKKRGLLKNLFGNTSIYEYSLLQYDSLGESHNYSFKDKNLNLLDIKASVNNSTGNYCVMGLYTENKKGAKGIFSLQLSPDELSELSYVKQPFSDAFVKNANLKFDNKSSKREPKKSKKKKEDEESKDESDDKPKSKYLGKLKKESEDTVDIEETKKESKSKKDENEDKEEKKDKRSTSKNEITNLNHVIDIEYDENDNPIGIFEKQWTIVVTSTTRNSNGTSSTKSTYYYYYGDVVVAKIENEEIAQTQIIRKNGYLVNIYYPQGINVVSNDNKLILTYKDKHIEYNKDDLGSKNKNATTNRELKYKMTGFQRRLSQNKSIITRPLGFKKIEIEYIKAK